MDLNEELRHKRRQTSRQAGKELPALPFEPALEPERGDDHSRRSDLAAALPSLVLAVIYGLALHTDLMQPLLTRRWLGTMMGIEFIVIHSLGFMMVFGLLSSTSHRIARPILLSFFWGLFALYFFAAFKLGGFAAVLAFASLTVITYVGFLLHPTEERFGQLMIRWLFNFMIFVAAAYLSGVSHRVETWPGSREALAFGMLNFAMIGILEGSGFYKSEGMRQVMGQFKKERRRDGSAV